MRLKPWLPGAAMLAASLAVWGALAQDKSADPDKSAATPKPDAKPSPKAEPKPATEPAAAKDGKPPETNGGKEPAKNGDDPAAKPDRDRLKRLAFGNGGGTGVQKVEPPQLPTMSLRGFIRSDGRPPAALLEIKDVGRWVVREGDRIPVMVAGAATVDAKGARVEGRGQTQIILLVKSVSAEGVVLETGVLAQTLVVR